MLPSASKDNDPDSETCKEDSYTMSKFPRECHPESHGSVVPGIWRCTCYQEKERKLGNIPNSTKGAYICFANTISTTSHNGSLAFEDGSVNIDSAIDRTSRFVAFHV